MVDLIGRRWNGLGCVSCVLGEEMVEGNGFLGGIKVLVCDEFL